MKAQTSQVKVLSARILLKLMSTVTEASEHSLQICSVYYWLDSKTALC